MVADKVADIVSNKKRKSHFFVLGWHVVAHGGRHGGRQKKKPILADMELDMVADKEVDVADMLAGHGC